MRSRVGAVLAAALLVSASVYMFMSVVSGNHGADRTPQAMFMSVVASDRGADRTPQADMFMSVATSDHRADSTPGAA